MFYNNLIRAKGFFVSFALGCFLASCASVNPSDLQRARLKCNELHPPIKESIKEYYSCVQKREPFGAWLEKGKRGKNDETKKLSAPNASTQFEKEISFINRMPAEDASWLSMELGVRAMAKAEIDLSRYLFNDAAKKVETIYGGSKQAKKARKAFSHEAEKLFIGESHERAMVFYYLGLLDLIKGDYQNARASFRASLIQDSIAGNKKHEQDFSSALWLQGWASRCVGSRQADSLFRQSYAITKTQAPRAGTNLLVVAEIGRGPFKLAQGRYGQRLAYGTVEKTPIETQFQPTAYDLYLADDLYFQATTRGKRTFDNYLANKAKSKRAAKNVAKGAFIAGAYLLDAASQMDDSKAAGVVALAGLGALAVSGISAGIGAAVNPMADIRTFRGMPESIYVGSFNGNGVQTLSALKGDRKLTNLLTYVKKNQNEFAVVYAKPRGTCSILWIKDISDG